jgi:Ca2+-binding RTX toxin-like protein
MVGGDGNDTYVVDHVGDVTTETSTLATQIDVVEASVSGHQLGVNVETLRLMGSGNLTGAGNDGNNRIIGNAGENSLSGNGGLDTLEGGTGNDYYSVDRAGEAVETSTLATEIDRVFSTVSYTLGANLEYLFLSDAASTASGTGNGLSNLISGNVSANKLDGAAGNDTLNGGLGNDSLLGGAGNDSLIDSLGNDTLRGGDGNDSLKGDAGFDQLFGDAGNDTLDGGANNDSMTGGAGNDVFFARLFTTFGTGLNVTIDQNIDAFTDFVSGADRIQLENAIFTQLTTTGTLGAGLFRASADGSAGDSNDRILYETDTGNLYYDSDGSGGNAKVLFAVLTLAPTLSASDFFVT